MTKDDLSKEQVDHLWVRVDTNKDGVIDFPEFKKVFEGGLEFYFDMIDMNMDGLIEAQEVVEFDTLFGEGDVTIEQAQGMVAYIDENTTCGHVDGAIEKSEFFEIIEGNTDCKSGEPAGPKGPDAPECKEVEEGFKNFDTNKDKHIDEAECLATGQCDQDCCTHFLGFAKDATLGLTLGELYKAFDMGFCVAPKH